MFVLHRFGLKDHTAETTLSSHHDFGLLKDLLQFSMGVVAFSRNNPNLSCFAIFDRYTPPTIIIIRYFVVKTQ